MRNSVAHTVLAVVFGNGEGPRLPTLEQMIGGLATATITITHLPHYGIWARVGVRSSLQRDELIVTLGNRVTSTRKETLRPFSQHASIPGLAPGAPRRQGRRVGTVGITHL